MAKIVLGKRPEKFPRTVTFPMLDGTDGVIKVEFKYRSKKEYATLVDELAASAKLPELEAGAKLPDYAEIVRMAVEKNSAYLIKILNSWDLDGELNEENLVELADAYPAAAIAIMDAYRLACIEGKTGN